MKLTARDALTDRLVRVNDEQRPETAGGPAGTVYAVFSVEDGSFLDLVTSREIAQFPQRIFGDLIACHGATPRLGEAAPLEEVYRYMEAGDLTVLAVMEDAGGFLGAVTRGRLLEVLLDNSRRLSAALEAEHQRLQAWSERLKELNRASRKLLELMARVQPEKQLAQNGLEVLVSLVRARYGAVGLVDENGKLTQFLTVGLTPAEIRRIGEPPQGKGLLGVVIRENQTLRLADVSADRRSAGFPPGHPIMKSLLAVPVADRGHVYGRVYLCDKVDGTPFTEEDEVMVGTFAQSLALALVHVREQTERRRAEEQTSVVLRENRQLTQQLFSVQEVERQNIVHELHDELGQYVTAMQADVETMRLLSEGKHPDIYNSASAVAEVLHRFYDVLHTLMHQLRPVLLDELGLAEAIRDNLAQMCAGHPDVACKLATFGRLDDLDDNVSITAYRIVQECLNNALRHSGASEVEVRVCRNGACGGAALCCTQCDGTADGGEVLRLAVSDNGRGLTGNTREGRLGLVGIRERVGALNGTFSVRSQAGKGVCIAVQIPLGHP